MITAPRASGDPEIGFPQLEIQFTADRKEAGTTSIGSRLNQIPLDIPGYDRGAGVWVDMVPRGIKGVDVRLTLEFNQVKYSQMFFIRYASGDEQVSQLASFATVQEWAKQMLDESLDSPICRSSRYN